MKQDLEQVMSASYIPYSGCLIEKRSGKFKNFIGLFDTLEEAKTAIDNEFKAFNESLKKQKLCSSTERKE